MLDRELLRHVIPVNDTVIFRSHDPNDVKLGTVISRNFEDYKNSDVIIIGCPQDMGVKRNNGREGARFAPTEIRKQLYKLSAPASTNNLGILDLGDISIKNDLEETHAILEQLMIQFLSDNKHVIVLGGGNDISYPDVKALSKVYNKEIVALNIDKHFDVRDLFPINSGTPYRYLLEEEFLLPENFYEIGIEEYANSPIYYDYLRRKGVNIYELEDLRNKGIHSAINNIINAHYGKPFFFGFDIDSVRSADAPGVSAPSVTGFSTEEIIKIAQIAGKYPFTKIIEISEFNPKYDVDGRTAKLSALIVYTYLVQASLILKKNLIPQKVKN